jgi:hypothetical protein
MATNRLDSIKRIFVQGLGMQINGPVKISPQQKRILSQQWNIPFSLEWQLYELSSPNANAQIRIRLLVFTKTVPAMHDSYQIRETGPLALGFPNNHQNLLDEAMRVLGYRTKAPAQTFLTKTPDGGEYKTKEAVYLGPDLMHVISLERENGILHQSPSDSLSAMGGPGYVTMVVTGMSDQMVQFFRYVLGWEVRRDNELVSARNTAWGLEEGVRYRSTFVYAKGAVQGHIVLIDFRDGGKIVPKNKPRLPNRGMAMYSLLTQNLNEVKALAQQQRIQVLSDIQSYDDPLIGRVRSMVLMAPNEMAFEIIEKPKPLF